MAPSCASTAPGEGLNQLSTDDRRPERRRRHQAQDHKQLLQHHTTGATSVRLLLLLLLLGGGEAGVHFRTDGADCICQLSVQQPDGCLAAEQ
jgi:hypothetical protein